MDLLSCFLSIHPAHNPGYSFRLGLGAGTPALWLAQRSGGSQTSFLPLATRQNTDADRDLGRAMDTQQVLKVTISRTRLVWSVKRAPYDWVVRGPSKLGEGHLSESSGCGLFGSGT